MKVPLTDRQAGILDEFQTRPFSSWALTHFELRGDPSSYGFATAKLNKEDGFSCA